MRYEGNEPSGGKLAAQAYWNAFKKLRTAWQEVFDEELQANGSRAMETYENALEFIKVRLREDAAGRERLREVLDVRPDETMAEVLLAWADMDDLTPAQVRQAMLDQCRALGTGRHDLRGFLRTVLDAVFEDSGARRPRVGANRHWPRLRQYLRELEADTDWSPHGRGVRLANIGGRGPVARDPRDPALLGLVIDTDYL